MKSRDFFLNLVSVVRLHTGVCLRPQQATLQQMAAAQMDATDSTRNTTTKMALTAMIKFNLKEENRKYAFTERLHE